jgi:hypothetical protein
MSNNLLVPCFLIRGECPMTHLSSGDDTGIVDRQEQGERERTKGQIKRWKTKKSVGNELPPCTGNMRYLLYRLQRLTGSAGCKPATKLK